MTSDYSPAAFSFAISFRDDGAEAIDGAFQEVSGLDNERQVHDLEEGGENRFVHAFPGSIKHSNLVLKRGQLATTSRLFAWCRQTFEGGLAQAIQPQNISVSLLVEKATSVLTWEVRRAWPVKWSIESFSGSADRVAIETLEFAYESIVRQVHRGLT